MNAFLRLLDLPVTNVVYSIVLQEVYSQAFIRYVAVYYRERLQYVIVHAIVICQSSSYVTYTVALIMTVVRKVHTRVQYMHVLLFIYIIF